MPGSGRAGTATPGCAPSTPASHEPSVETTSPFSYSAVSSPRYQRFPAESWAYQSRVSSTSAPSAVTTSWTTRASMPRSTVYVSSSTVTSTRWTPPSPSVSSYTQRSPTSIGQYGLVISTLKSAGSSSTGSLPCGRGVPSAPTVPEAPDDPPTQAVSDSTPTAA